MKFLTTFNKIILLLSLVFFLNSFTNAQENILKNLNGVWELIDTESGGKYPAIVPGTYHLDLMRAEEIPDLYIGTNAEKYQYLEKKDWIYKKVFKLSKSELTNNKIELHC